MKYSYNKTAQKEPSILDVRSVFIGQAKKILVW